MFLVLEMQTSDKVATITTSYDDRKDAESKYHAILSAAATSSVPKHSAILINDDGVTIKHETYFHVTEAE